MQGYDLTTGMPMYTSIEDRKVTLLGKLLRFVLFWRQDNYIVTFRKEAFL